MDSLTPKVASVFRPTDQPGTGSLMSYVIVIVYTRRRTVMDVTCYTMSVCITQTRWPPGCSYLTSC